MSQHPLDPVGVVIALVAVVLSPDLAAVIGPYTVIIIASTIGAAWSLGGKPPMDKWSALGYFVMLAGTACMITVAATLGLAKLLGLTDAVHWLIAPVALLIGGVGDNWPAIGRWIIARLGRLIERRTGDTP